MKWLWLLRHDAERARRAKRLRLIGDELAWWLSGRHVHEAGTAGLTGLVDIHSLTWRREAMRALGMDQLAFGPLVRAGAELGTLHPSAADALGLRPDCRVAAGCLDQYAGAIGAGVLGPDDVLETTGTVLSVVRTVQGRDDAPAQGVFQGPAWRPGVYHQMCFGGVSANLLERWRREHAPDRAFAQLDRAAAEVPAGAEGLTLDAEASDAAGRAIFRNHQPHHGHAHEVRAILEGVADALAAQLQRLCGGRMPRRVVAAGGAARSETWRRIKSERLGVPVVAAACEEPACLGAAKLARGIAGQVR
jgi:autoinducer 2 (AI-2) kinase